MTSAVLRVAYCYSLLITLALLVLSTCSQNVEGGVSLCGGWWRWWYANEGRTFAHDTIFEVCTSGRSVTTLSPVTRSLCRVWYTFYVNCFETVIVPA